MRKSLLVLMGIVILGVGSVFGFDPASYFSGSKGKKSNIPKATAACNRGAKADFDKKIAELSKRKAPIEDYITVYAEYAENINRCSSEALKHHMKRTLKVRDVFGEAV